MIASHRKRHRATLALLSALLSACGTSEPCTLIGCESGLIVRVSGLPDGEATIALQVAGQEPVIRKCQSTATCELPGVQFTDQTPASATILVTSGDFSKSFVVTDLDYEDHRPNGPGCPPVCRTAVVTFSA